MAAVGGMIGGAVHQGFGEAANRSQRRRKLVRGIGDKIRLALLDQLQTGDVIEQHQCAGRLAVLQR